MKSSLPSTSGRASPTVHIPMAQSYFSQTAPLPNVSEHESRPRSVIDNMQSLLSTAKQQRLDPVQARITFVAYLERVKQRLMQGLGTYSYR